MKPKLEVRIEPCCAPSPEISLQIERYVWNDIGLNPDEVGSQSLMLKATNNSIERLGAMMWLNGSGPTTSIGA